MRCSGSPWPTQLPASTSSAGSNWCTRPANPSARQGPIPAIGGEAKMCPGSVDFTAVVIPWQAWVEAWEGEASRVAEAGGAAVAGGVLQGPVPPPDGHELG